MAIFRDAADVASPRDAGRRRARPHQVQGHERRREDHPGRPHDHRKSASGFHGWPGPRSSPRKLGPERHRVRDVRERHLRRAEGVLRLPQLLHERPQATCWPIRGRPTNPTPSIRSWIRTTPTATRSAASTSRTARTSGCAICSSGTTCRRRSCDGCRATRVYLQAENLFTFTGYYGPRSGVAGGERHRTRRRHPRSVSRR